MKLFFMIIMLLIFLIFLFRNKSIETKIIINQPLGYVWDVFTCIPSYSEWNTLFSLDQFPTYIGQKITVDLYDENREVQFRMNPIVKEIDVYHLEWEGKFYVNGLFNGRHKFIFTEIDADTTQLVQKEDFTGLLVPIFSYLIIRPTKLKFRIMNESFKKYVEGQRHR